MTTQAKLLKCQKLEKTQRELFHKNPEILNHTGHDMGNYIDKMWHDRDSIISK